MTSVEKVGPIVPTKYWHRLPDGKVQCDLCPRFCQLQEGQQGLCFVRARQGDAIVLTTYGRSSGFCVDPIEKKPLNHFLPGTPVLSFGTAGCNLACRFCVAPGTLIATSQGPQPIEAIFDGGIEQPHTGDGAVRQVAGTFVFTVGGKLAPVAKAFRHAYRGELIRLKAMSTPELCLTPNHEVFAVHRHDLAAAPKKIPAGALTFDHYLVVPKRAKSQGRIRLDVEAALASEPTGSANVRQRRIEHARLVDVLRSKRTSREIAGLLGYHPVYVRKLRALLRRGLLDLTQRVSDVLHAADGEVRFARERRPGIPGEVIFDENFAWLLGIYCAEGHVTAQKDRPNSYQLVFSFGRHEGDLVCRTAEILGTVFGIRPRIVPRRTTVTVEAYKASLAVLFRKLCGSGARHKRVPPPVFEAPEETMRAFLAGYLAGDGTTTPTHLVGNTVSRHLAHDLFELGLHLGVLPHIHLWRPPATKLIEGRTVRQSPLWYVKFLRGQLEGRRWRKNRARDVGGYFLVPLRRIEREFYDGDVYNLEVDDSTHSYTASSLAVGNCQNWDISKSREIDILADEAPPEAIARAAKSLGCRSVAFTYNDPVIFHEYAIDVAEACHALGVRTVAVTAGEVCPEPRAEFYRSMDAANVDLKGFTEKFYHDLCAGHLQPVLDTLVYLKRETKVWFEITTLLIPGQNDSEEELEEMTQWVVRELGPDVPLHFSAFHPDWRMLDTPPTPPETLTRARRIAMKNGVRYAYTGNVHDEEGGSTYCHRCGKVLIGRDWYVITAWNLTGDGCCRACGERCAGVFEGPAGRWGGRRLPVRISEFAQAAGPA